MTTEQQNTGLPEPTAKVDTAQIGLNHLWHLQAIGLFEKCKFVWDDKAEREDIVRLECKPANGWLPKDETKRARVAIIDNGMARDHPNLERCRIVNAIDFTSDYRGVFYDEQHRGDINSYVRSSDVKTKKLRDLLEALENGGSSKFAEALEASSDGLKNAISELKQSGFQPRKFEAKIPDPAYRFGAHGTACAGLVAADANPKPLAGTENGSFARDPDPYALRYSGVDPTAEIIPINTVYNHEYWPLSMALLYAFAMDADVILIPRAVDPRDARPGTPVSDGNDISDPLKTRFNDGEALSKELNAEQLVFEALLEQISDRIPVVVAAGNQGGDVPQYPASLAVGNAKNGIICNNLIVAGAMTSRGLRSSYSNFYAGDADSWDAVDGNTAKQREQKILFAPSNDGELINSDFFRYDKLVWRGRRILQTKDTDYSPYGVFAIDIPGEYGYEVVEQDVDNDFDEPGMSAFVREQRKKLQQQPGSLYTIFGGTSAASAIIAGTVSAMQRERKFAVGKALLTGAQAKEILLTTVKNPKEMNVHSEGDGPKEDLCGSGDAKIPRPVTVAAGLNAHKAIQKARDHE